MSAHSEQGLLTPGQKAWIRRVKLHGQAEFLLEKLRIGGGFFGPTRLETEAANLISEWLLLDADRAAAVREGTS